MKKNLLLLMLPFAAIFTACSGGVENNSEPTGENVIPVQIGVKNSKTNSINTPVTSVTICNNNNKCQTINNILIDTGSVGLRIESSVIDSDLRDSLLQSPVVTNDGESITQCMLFGGGYAYGSVVNAASVKIGSLYTQQIPIQLVDNNTLNVPTSCKEKGMPINLPSVGINGTLGIGPISTPLPNYAQIVYAVAADGIPVEVISPVGEGIPTLEVNTFAYLNKHSNGVIFKLPNLSTPSESPISGYLILGIDTANNNQVSTNTIKLLGNPNTGWGGFISTASSNPNEAYSNVEAMFDSGAALLNFMNVGIQTCDPMTGLIDLYCPSSSPFALQVMLGNYNSTQNANLPLNLTLVNYLGDAIFSSVIIPSLGLFMTANFDVYGIPAFLGKTIYVEFESTTSNQSLPTPLGQAPAWGIN